MIDSSNTDTKTPEVTPAPAPPEPPTLREVLEKRLAEPTLREVLEKRLAEYSARRDQLQAEHTSALQRVQQIEAGINQCHGAALALQEALTKI